MDRDLALGKSRRVLDDISDSDKVDRISFLPDDILVRILSFLKTKEAVATSVLSRRWEFLWTLTPDIDLSDEFDHSIPNGFTTKPPLYKEFVDRVIFYHGSSTIRKFHLRCYLSVLHQFIYAWICAVITCNIEELVLNASCFEAKELPRRVFTCKTLTTMKIGGMFVLDIPNSMCFPCLKILWLRRVVYVDNASAQNLFASCPVLEDLAITRQGWDGIQTINLSIPSLKRLSIHSIDLSCKIEINAPCLEYLEYQSGFLNDFSANSSCSLVELVEARILDGCGSGLLNAISGVQNLTLGGDVMLELSTVIKHHGLPLFHNLKKLELYVGTPVHWDELPNLLECSPKLEVLNFPDGLVVPRESGRDYYRFYWHRPDNVAECLQMNLKKVEIFNFVGLPGEMYLVAYLLECGEVLEKMIIHGFDYSARPRMRKKMEGIKEDVLSFERGSSTCEVEFII